MYVLCCCDRFERNMWDLFSRRTEGDVEIVNLAGNLIKDQSVNKDIDMLITFGG